jgi:hypothetical protein
MNFVTHELRMESKRSFNEKEFIFDFKSCFEESEITPILFSGRGDLN